MHHAKQWAGGPLPWKQLSSHDVNDVKSAVRTLYSAKLRLGTISVDQATELVQALKTLSHNLSAGSTASWKECSTLLTRWIFQLQHQMWTGE